MASFSGAGSGVLLSTLFSNNLSLHPVDILILGVFLVATLIVGLNTGRQIKNLKDYALGGKDFSTITLVATIVATYSSGSFLFVCLENTYASGLYYIIPGLAMPIALWFNGHLAIRMGPLMDYMSVAEAIGSVYGRTVQVITAFSSVLAKIGYIAVQFKALAKILEILFHLDGTASTIIASSIVIIYSASGGVKAVAFTDVLQFITFGTVLPLLAFVVWSNMKAPQEAVFTTLSTNPLFNPSKIIGWHSGSMDMLALLVYFCVPTLYVPSMFQRAAMAKNVYQARRAYNYAAWVFLLILVITIWIGIELLADHPGMAKEQIVPYLVKTHTYVGLRGLLGIGVMALAMSTADSSLNSLSVIFANDIIKPFTGKKEISVTVAKAFSVIVGCASLMLALRSADLLSLLLLSGSFYMPIFAVPMLLLILGFHTSRRAVLFSMIAGTTATIFWSFAFKSGNNIPPGMLANLLVLLGTHYFLGEPGGWQKVDPNSLLGRERAARKEARLRRKEAFKNFSLYHYLRTHLPQQDYIYFLFGLYAIVANYLAFYTIDTTNLPAYRAIFSSFVPTLLLIVAVFMALSLWPSSAKRERFVTFFWPLGLSFTLFFSTSLVVLMSQFQPLQFMVLVFNLLVAVLLLPGTLVFPLAFLGITLALSVFTLYTGLSIPWDASSFLQFGGFYGLVLLGCFLVVLFRHQQDYHQLGRENEALQSREKDQQERLLQATSEKQAALAAFQHTGAEKLLAIARELQKLPVAEEGKEKMQALQTELLPIAFHLQGIGTRAQDYLRLKKAKLTLKSWCDQIKADIIQKGVTIRFHCDHKTEWEQIKCDPAQLTSLVVNSIVALSTQAEGLEDKPTIFFRLEDTQLGYPLEDVKKGYVKYVPAVRMAITVGDDLPPVKDSYRPELNGSSRIVPETTQDPAKFANNRIVKSHYGYEEVTDDTLIYVVPVDVEDVRPKDMDKDYMEVGAKPIRADDHFKNDEGIDAQVQEAAFLADVAARSDADLGMVQMALETIKWYHGPKNRHSGEPFYLHPLTVAHIVLDYNTDEETIIGALLHDTVEDTPMQLEHIESMFGKEAAKVVDVVTHLQSIEGSIYKIKMSASENLQMLDRTDSKRGLYVKLADRMHNMRTIGSHNNPKRRQEIAQETANFFVPLTKKLGLKKAAAEFEKMCYEVFRQSY